MTITYLDFPRPILQIDGFLPPARAGQVLEECVALEPRYRHADIGDGHGRTVVDKAFRRNYVVHLDRVLGRGWFKNSIVANLMHNGAPPFAGAATCGFWCRSSQRIWREKGLIFDVINRATKTQIAVSRYGDRDFYRWHADGFPSNPHRLVTGVYYVNAEPERFTGGSIRFRSGNTVRGVAPKHNRLIVFPSDLPHRVDKVKLASPRFADGRFSINVWFGFNG